MTDYYEVLGIRRSATALEIELAYKGRRAQYHPDRYAGADTDTVRWATQAMQEVNEAYAGLSDESRRAAYDRRLDASSATPTAAQNPKPSPQAEGMRAALTHAFRDLLPRRVHIAPSIPLKKLSNALAELGWGLSDREVVALVDTTLFGGGGDGLLVTETEFRAKESFSSVSRFGLEGLTDLQAEDGNLYLAGRKLINCSMVDKAELATFAAVMRAQAVRLKSQPRDDSPHSPQEAPDSGTGRMLLERVTMELANLLRNIEPIEGPHRQLVDRANAATHFAELEQAIRSSKTAQDAISELESIWWLCQRLETLVGQRSDATHLDLMRPASDDSQLVRELKQLYLLLRFASEQMRHSGGRA